jgi:hypothetical protein
LEEQLKNIHQSSEDQIKEKEKLELVTKSLGELKEMLTTLRGGVNVTNGSALIDNVIEKLETINNYTTNNYNDYEEVLRELGKKKDELEKLKSVRPKFLSFEEMNSIKVDLTVKKTELGKRIIQVKDKLEKFEQEQKEHAKENYFILLQVLLDSQETLTVYQNSPNTTPLQIACVEKQLRWAKRGLSGALQGGELNILCQEQDEIVKAQLKLEKNQQLEAKIETI